MFIWSKWLHTAWCGTARGHITLPEESGFPLCIIEQSPSWNPQNVALKSKHCTHYTWCSLHYWVLGQMQLLLWKQKCSDDKKERRCFCYYKYRCCTSSAFSRPASATSEWSSLTESFMAVVLFTDVQDYISNMWCFSLSPLLQDLL